MRQQTTFSGIRLGDAPTRDDGKSPNGVVGFHAHKKAEQKVNQGWDMLDNYRASGWHGTCVCARVHVHVCVCVCVVVRVILPTFLVGYNIC